MNLTVKTEAEWALDVMCAWEYIRSRQTFILLYTCTHTAASVGNTEVGTWHIRIYGSGHVVHGQSGCVMPHIASLCFFQHYSTCPR